jgi:hypothetical protein
MEEGKAFTCISLIHLSYKERQKTDFLWKLFFVYFFVLNEDLVWVVVGRSGVKHRLCKCVCGPFVLGISTVGCLFIVIRC